MAATLMHLQEKSYIYLQSTFYLTKGKSCR